VSVGESADDESWGWKRGVGGRLYYRRLVCRFGECLGEGGIAIEWPCALFVGAVTVAIAVVVDGLRGLDGSWRGEVGGWRFLRPGVQAWPAHASTEAYGALK
jgi:hypothetical protein